MTALGFTLSAQSANSNCVGAVIVVRVRAGVLHASRCLQQRNIKFKARAGARERSGTGGRRKGHHPLHARDASPSHKGSRERISSPAEADATELPRGAAWLVHDLASVHSEELASIA